MAGNLSETGTGGLRGIRGRSSRELFVALGLGFALLLLCIVANAWADGSGSSTKLFDSEVAMEEAVSHQELTSQMTNPSAAEQLPHQNLDREEALELIRTAFEPMLQGPAGPFDELNIERFLSDNVGVVSAGELPESIGLSISSGPDQDAYTGATLIESTIPLRTEDRSGNDETVDLSLESVEGELQPSNPLVEVGIPAELGEGLSFPESGVEIELVGGPQDRKPTTFEESLAFYPNVATDTDLVLAPTPSGLETLTQLRSAGAPHTQVFRFSLPEGAELKETSIGGAEVSASGEPLLQVMPPATLDAAGQPVESTLEVAGDSLTLGVNPDETTTYPLLLDPLIFGYESFLWYNEKTTFGLSSWHTYSNNATALVPGTKSVCSGVLFCFLGAGVPGLDVRAPQGGTLAANSQTNWWYDVPRKDADEANFGAPPTSFVSTMILQNLGFYLSSFKKYPQLLAGIYDEYKSEWRGLYQHRGNEGALTELGTTYKFENKGDENAKSALGISLNTPEAGTTAAAVEAYLGTATIGLGDPEAPTFSPFGHMGWISGDTAVPIPFSVSDPGLGVARIKVSDQKPLPNTQIWTTYFGPKPWPWLGTGCGGASEPCPRTWKSSDSTQPDLVYDPSKLPAGINNLKVTAEDPLSHVSQPVFAQVKIDRQAPSIDLSGTLTEQEVIGIRRGSYVLQVDATDGTAELPQSGVAEVLVKLDGQTVETAEPDCSTQNCSASFEWLLDSGKYANGSHSVEVVAVDAIGRTATKSLAIDLQPPPPPSVSLSGTMTEQGSVGTSRPRYKLEVDASAEAGERLPSTFSSSFGTSGTGNGQFEHPAGAALDPKGFLWVVDQDRDRIQKFKEGGEYVTKFGSSGTADGKFGRPTDVAIDSKGNFWVTDAGNKRVEMFNEKREYVDKIESAGSGIKLGEAESIAVDGKGNVWVADTYNGRLVKYNAQRAFIKVIGGAGELVEPAGIDVGPEGRIWVVDRQLNRVVKFNEAGEFLSQFGTEGSGPRQFDHPGAIEVDTQGNVWVGDEGNDRVLEFDQEGDYVAQFGSQGSGQGEFNFSSPMGITADSKGHIWVADNDNDRVQRWQIPAYVPTGSGSLGSSGSGQGQFNHPAGIDVDLEGNIWVADRSNHRLQKFNAAGAFQESFGSLGTNPGQMRFPSDVAIDSQGNFWVANRGNCRIDKYSPIHKYLLSINTESRVGTCVGTNGAEAVAVDDDDEIWVAETYNGRVKQYSQEGELLLSIGSTSAATIYEPTGIDVGPDGHVWVTEWGYHYVLEFNQAGNLVRKFGTEGAGDGQFRHPDVIDVDARGNVWVGDEDGSRIQEFNHNGEYVAQFGSHGSGEGQFSFSYPMGIATDPNGNLWISDPSNNRVQKWHSSSSSTSEVVVDIAIDGDQVDSESSSCAAETCPLYDEWMLEAPNYSTGDHTVQVKVTDGLGGTTSKTLPIEIEPDNAGPALQVFGDLVEAPKGWVEQKSYAFVATATDNGYGVTSLDLKIDGDTVKSQTVPCGDGGCDQGFSPTVDMAGYSGGAHDAELIATDGAGNVTKDTWTINVNPDGDITTEEAVDTLQAIDETAETTAVVPTSEIIDPHEIEEGNNPAISNLESTGTAVPSRIEQEPAEGFTITAPDDEEIHIAPTSTDSTATDVAVAGGVSAVAANTESGTDTVIRPIYDGAMVFQSIRDSSSPEEYSWEVDLASGQTIETYDSRSVQVFYEDGSPAMLIEAIEAHDATGGDVPTTLTIEDNIITLHVLHNGKGFVYPILAGPSFQVGYATVEIIPPPAPPSAATYWEESNLIVGAPEPVSGSEASASSAGEKRRTFVRVRCGLYASYPTGTGRPPSWDCGNPFTGDRGEGILWQAAMRGAFLYTPDQEVRHNGAKDCYKWLDSTRSIDYDWVLHEAYQCRYGPKTTDGNGGASASGGHYLRAQAHWELAHRGWCGDNCGGQANPWIWEDKAIELHLWPSGSVQWIVP